MQELKIYILIRICKVYFDILLYIIRIYKYYTFETLYLCLNTISFPLDHFDKPIFFFFFFALILINLQYL